MTIRKGEPWGNPVDRPPDLRIVASDAGDRPAYRHRPGPDPIGLVGGDLSASLGRPAERPAMQRLPIDLLRVTTRRRGVDRRGARRVRRSWWRGPVTAVMNVDHFGEWNVAPRAHPNDGGSTSSTVDAGDVDPATAGRHAPDSRPVPTCPTRRSGAHGDERRRGRSPRGRSAMWVDGRSRRLRRRRCVSIRVVPDAFAVLI